MNGFWIHDLGGLNAVTHLWEYDNLAHRAEIRANLAADPEWIADYVTHLTPMLAEQENAIVTQPHWASGIMVFNFVFLFDDRERLLYTFVCSFSHELSSVY